MVGHVGYRTLFNKLTLTDDQVQNRFRIGSEEVENMCTSAGDSRHT